MVTSPTTTHPMPIEGQQTSIEKEGYSFCTSTPESDPEWDEFVGRAPEGQFQQTTAWAAYKSKSGWTPHRILVRKDGTIVAGYQILCRRSRGMLIGDLRKGPLIYDGNPALTEAVYRFLTRDASRLGLRALLVQAPFPFPGDSELHRRLGLLEANPIRTPEATCLLNTSGDLELIRKRMSKNTRYQINKAEQRGMLVREGSDSDVPEFFSLMEGSCRRQHSAPNPATLTQFTAFWKAFRPLDAVRLLFAEFEGRKIAGAVLIHVGTKGYIWKKGWNSEHQDKFPNDLLYMEIIRRANELGIRTLDHGAFARKLAEILMSGGKLEGDDAKGRDMFFLRFGGEPRLLGKPAIFFPFGPLRVAARIAFGLSKRFPRASDALVSRFSSRSKKPPSEAP